MTILALGGSIRAVNPKSAGILLEKVHQATDLENYIELVRGTLEKFSKNSKRPIFTNSEIVAGAALCGAKNSGSEVDFFPLVRLFPHREKPLQDSLQEEEALGADSWLYQALDISDAKKKQLIQKTKNAAGVILSSPIYFGDRSSVSNKFLQIATKENLLKNKLVACLSVGAKRNGGQESTNLFQLNEALLAGAHILGNGPKTSQYGGTAVGGDLARVIDDHWGLETAYCTGVRMSQVSTIASSPNVTLKQPLNLTCLVTMDTPQRILHQTLSNLFEDYKKTGNSVNLRVIQLIDDDIERCIACNICPIPEYRSTDGKDYACIIRSPKDSMKGTRKVLLESDALMIAGANLVNTENMVYRYQAFTERTRFIRRNDFELTNKPICAFVLDEIGASTNSIFQLKVMTSYMRHNMVVFPPITKKVLNGKTILDCKESLAEFIQNAGDFVAKSKEGPKFNISYKAGGDGGYKDNRLDDTSALR